MWIITTLGMYSAVEHRDDPDLIMVRARSYTDLVFLTQTEALDDRDDEIVESKPGQSDYRYRITIPRTVWQAALVELAADIDYDNFKDAVLRKHSRGFAQILHRVWRDLLDIEQLPGAVKR